MGVRGLQGFLHENPEQCIIGVNIGQLASTYRKTNNKCPEIVIDVCSCVYYIIRNQFWRGGGQLKEFACTFEKIIRNLQSFDIRVTALINGHSEPRYDLVAWISTTEERLTTIKEFYESLHCDPNSNIVQNYFEVYPDNIWKVVLDILIRCDCQMSNCVMTSGRQIASYAIRNKCFGILAQDSDFVIFNCAEYYFSMKELNYETLDTIAYSSEGLARLLNLEISDFPLLASVIGNDIISTKLLYKFHKSLFGPHERESRNDNWFHRSARFVKRSAHKNMATLGKEVLGIFEAPLMRRSIMSYITTYQRDIQFSDVAKWAEVQRLALQMYQDATLPLIVYDVVFNSLYHVVILWEEPENENYQSQFEMVQKLRRRIYGILLNQKPCLNQRPHTVKEIFVNRIYRIEKNYIEPIIPKQEIDLVQLWTDTDERIAEAKIDLFCSSLNIEDKSILLLEERHVLIPVIALKYIMSEQLDITRWELEAVVASMLLVNYYSIEDLQAIPELPLDPAGIHLYWFLIRVFDTVSQLNCICGSPLDSDLANPVNFQDGKLFQLKYRQAKGNESFEKLCDFRPNEIETGMKILAVINHE